jgi:FixJ family two-component response regulator
MRAKHARKNSMKRDGKVPETGTNETLGADDARLLQLILRGRSAKDIAAELGVDASIVMERAERVLKTVEAFCYPRPRIMGFLVSFSEVSESLASGASLI